MIALSASVTASTAGAGAAGDNIVIAAPTNGWIVLLGYQLIASAAANVRLQSDVTGGSPVNITGDLPLAAKGGVTAPPSFCPYATLPIGKSLVVNVSAGVVTGTIQYAIQT